MLCIKELCVSFRKAMDDAWENGDFIKCSTFSKFPQDCCDMTCDLLGCFLAENGIYTYQINGQHFSDSLRRHSWLVTENGVVIDITGDQFNGKGLFVDYVDPVYVDTVESFVHKDFCKRRLKEENTIFADEKYFVGFGNTPNYRQKSLKDLYDIIKMFL